jgi:G3E family GTPase
MLPATVITGFLGSGKTTLLNRLLRDPALAGSLVIVNEFGEIGIDHLVIAAPAENVRLLSSGCMCCEVRGELAATLAEVWREKEAGQLPGFERIFIETSGLADPVPIVQSIAADATLELDCVVTVADALHAAYQLGEHEEARKQVALADILLLSKVDIADAAEIEEARSALAGINAAAELIPAARGAIDPQRLLGARVRRRDIPELPHGETAHTHGIRTFALTLAAPVSDVGLATWLNMLASFKAAHLLRVKGIVDVAGEPWLVDVVQSVVHEPQRLDAWPGPERGTRLVFIVRELTRETLEQTFAAFALGDLPETKCFDAAAYGRFRAVANRFLL